MYLFAEVVFHSGRRKHLPVSGYRPDATFNEKKDYWGITFSNLPDVEFDCPVPAIIRFSFQESHYDEVRPGQAFQIMEGARQVGEGTIIAIQEENDM